MTVKERVLILLEENKNTTLSGEEIAKTLSCSRAAIWKAVRTLQSEGYNITGVNNKGYTLTSSPDVLSQAFIEDKLKEAGFDIPVITKSIVDSTNTQLKLMAGNGETRDIIMISEEQTAGKGRRGRSFFSPKNTGIYLSFLLHPNVPVYEAPVLTTMAATAEAIAIDNVLKQFDASDSSAHIKWVNDIYMHGKKVSGILTEASTSIEDNSLEYAVLGIGINLYEPDDGFPEEIKNVAGSIFTDNLQRENLRNIMASELIINFLKLYHDGNSENTGKLSRSYITEYKKRSIVLGKEVTLLTPNHEPISGNHSTATVIDINDDCHLLLRYNDGTESYISGGEISVRL